MINHDLIDIFVLGDIDVDSVKEMVEDTFNINTFKKREMMIYI